MSDTTKSIKVLITNREVPQDAIDILGQSCEVIVCQKFPPVRSEILEKVRGVDGILWSTHEMLNAEVLDAAGSNLKAVSTMSAGLDKVDVPELKKRKIPLGHTPTVLNDAVADLAIGLMIAAARRFHEGRLTIENSNWDFQSSRWMLGQDIRSSTVGLVGFGGIGQTIAKRLQGFEISQILYTSRNPSANAEEYKAKHVSFAELLKKSDFVIVACPLTDQTKEMFNQAAFAKMKPTSVFVNIARGKIVDQNALYDALKNKTIFAAGLDVMTPEPLLPSDPLLQLPNCVVIPHLGSATLRTRSDMATIAAHNILRGIAGEPMFAPVYEL